jgi:hypothetical protein
MSRWPTILLGVLAVAAVTYLAITEPLSRSRREWDLAARDGRVLALDPAKVRTVRIVSGETELVFHRRDSGWQLGEKSKDRADRAALDRILETASQLTFLDRISGGELTDDKALADFGLRNPKRKIVFEGGTTTTLSLGREGAGENRLYARVEGEPEVYLISDQILRQAFQPAAAFRDRRLTDLSPDQVDRLILRRPGGEIELVRDARGWQIVRPLHTAADDRKVTEFLRLLLALRIEEYLADDTGDLSPYGLVEGQNEITVFAEGSERPQTLRFGADRDGSVLAQFTARDSVYRLPGEARRLLEITPEVLRDRRLVTVNPDLVDRIRIAVAGEVIRMDRDADGWTVRGTDGPFPASTAAVQALFDALATAESTEFLPATPARLAAAGLDQPPLLVEFVSVLSENTPETRAGENVVAAIAFGTPANGRLPARVGDAPEILSVDEGLLPLLPAKAESWRAPR